MPPATGIPGTLPEPRDVGGVAGQFPAKAVPACAARTANSSNRDFFIENSFGSEVRVANAAMTQPEPTRPCSRRTATSPDCDVPGTRRNDVKGPRTLTTKQGVFG